LRQAGGANAVLKLRVNVISHRRVHHRMPKKIEFVSMVLRS
jgi:hypothetical protein